MNEISQEIPLFTHDGCRTHGGCRTHDACRIPTITISNNRIKESKNSNKCRIKESKNSNKCASKKLNDDRLLDNYLNFFLPFAL